MEQSASGWAVETNDDRFEQDVMERSHEVPVVVDFWATWCEPCRLLAPVLERLVGERSGRVLLVKAELDQAPRRAGEFGVQAVPAVFAVWKGQVVDFFTGVLAPEQVRQWIDRVARLGDLDRAHQLESTDPAAAEAMYRQLWQAAPNDADAAIGLARTLVAQNRHDEAHQIIEQLEQRGFLEPEAEKIKAQLQLRRLGSVDLEEARRNADAHPDDLQAQLQLARALAAHQQFQPALDRCLAIIQRTKTGPGEEARQLMVDLFRIIPDEELVRQYRRRLSTLLY